MKQSANLRQSSQIGTVGTQMRRGALAASAASAPRPAREPPDYRSWSVEELRALACQLQLPGAAAKSRSELLRLFDAA
jgi:hypothetical protein